MTQSELSAKSALSQALLSKFEGGVSAPDTLAVAAIADATNYPVEFFYDHDRIYGFNGSVFFHRKRSDMPAKLLKRVHAMLNLTRMRLDKLLVAADVTPSVELIRMSVEDADSPEQIAGKVRAILQLPDGPISNLTEVLEDAGVIVAQERFHSRRMDAVSEWVPGHPPIVLMNIDDHVPGDRYRWTLAHELGHLVMHRFPSEEMEDEANRFAAEFLMPRRDIRPQLRTVRIQTLALLKAVWKVSMSALLERAKQLQTISSTQYRYMRINFGKLGYSTQEPPELAISIEEPTIISELIDLHLMKLRFSTAELAKLLRMQLDEFRTTYLRSINPHLVHSGLRLVSA
jgi:Zn-dependent peptidase ImmA (M78 family)